MRISSVKNIKKCAVLLSVLATSVVKANAQFINEAVAPKIETVTKSVVPKTPKNTANVDFFCLVSLGLDKSTVFWQNIQFTKK